MFLPDYILNTYKDLTAEFLVEHELDTLVLDIDNTLVPYEVESPTKELYEWFSSLENKGIKIAFVSNNNRARVELFNSGLNYLAFYKSKKPLTITMKKVMRELNSNPKSTAIMGDQIFTDVLAGKSMGFLTILVPPIKDKTDLFTKFKRKIERPCIKKYYKRLGENK